MTSRIKEQELLNRIAKLPREVEPDNDVWPRISARIGRPDVQISEPRNKWWAQAIAAAAVVAVALGWLLGANMNGQSAPVAKPILAETPAPGSERYVAALNGSEAEYQAAFREFIAIGDSRAHLADLTVEKIENSWAEMLRTERALSDALTANPNDPFLNKRMLELRARQLSFLRQIAALDRNNRRLTI